MDDLQAKNNKTGYRFVLDNFSWDSWDKIIENHLKQHDYFCEGVAEQLVGAVQDAYKLYDITLKWTEYGQIRQHKFDYVLIYPKRWWEPPIAYGIKKRGLRKDELDLITEFDEKYQQQQSIEEFEY